MDSPAPPAGWSAWSTEAFARAAAGPRPVLLLLAVRWSDPCRRFDRLVLDDPRIAARLRDQVVGVRVDADERPDIADRYGLGGWPSMAFLTPEGDPIGGGTATTDAFVARVVAQGDPAARAGHLLGSPLQPSHAAAIRLLLHHGKRAGGAAAVDLATALLDDIGWGPLSAGADGGVFRAVAEGAGPERVCLLEANAALLDAMLAAAETTGLERCRVRARELAAFVSSRLGGGAAGGFRHACWCEAREAGPEDGLASDGDPAGAAWQVDDRVFVDSSADAAAALLRAAAAFDDEAMASRAIAALDGLVARAYHRAAGLAHVLDPAPRVRGLLSDQVRASAALLDAAEAAGMRVYLDLAEELMRSALAKLWVPEAGALADRVVSPAGAGDVGLLGEPLFPLALNSLAARVLARLAALTGDAAFARRAREILGAFGATWAAAGLDGACYAEAVAEVCCGTLQRPGGS
jgi:uncharacterized protein YyaL (SSP411 family)